MMTHRLLLVDDQQNIHEDYRKALLRGSEEPSDLEGLETKLFGDKPPPATDGRLPFAARRLSSALQGQDALALVEASVAEDDRFAVAFIDMRMPPGWDGLTTIERIWQVDPDIHVVVCTAYSDHSWSDIVTRLDFTDRLLILKKPFDIVEVRQMATALCHKWTLARENRRHVANLERAMDVTERSLAAIVHSSVDPIVTVDANGALSDFNPAAAALLGWSKTQAVGCPFAAIVAPAERAKVDQALRRARDERVPVVETIWVTKAGEPVEVSLSFSPVRDSGGALLSIAAVARDERPRRAAEEKLRLAMIAAEASSRAKSEFLASMSHELRTPMNGIVGMVELLDATPLSAEQRELTEVLTESVRSLRRLVDDVLDLSKIEAGKMRLEDTSVDVCALVDQLASLFGKPATDKGLRLEVVRPREPVVVRCDGHRLRQVLSNLIGNAVKFTQSGSVAVSVAPSAATGGSERRLVFEVTDTGIGIPHSSQRAIFEPFVQADGSTTRRFGGSGLGLSISRRLVGLMGGELLLESSPGSGSTFRVVLPLLPSERSVPAPPPRDDEPFGGRTLRILVVDDQPINRVVASKLLRRLGCECVTAESGAEAVAKVAAERFDAVLMDCHMPVVDGFEATKNIRRAEPSSRRTPIAALTASTLEADRRHSFESGMDLFLTKPLTLSALRAGIERLVGVGPSHAA
jgi:PAS domain S-box-containing protein